VTESVVVAQGAQQPLRVIQPRHRTVFFAPRLPPHTLARRQRRDACTCPASCGWDRSGCGWTARGGTTERSALRLELGVHLHVIAREQHDHGSVLTKLGVLTELGGELRRAGLALHPQYARHSARRAVASVRAGRVALEGTPRTRPRTRRLRRSRALGGRGDCQRESQWDAHRTGAVKEAQDSIHHYEPRAVQTHHRGARRGSLTHIYVCSERTLPSASSLLSVDALAALQPCRRS
jgi:hypothetical protein